MKSFNIKVQTVWIHDEWHRARNTKSSHSMVTNWCTSKISTLWYFFLQ